MTRSGCDICMAKDLEVLVIFRETGKYREVL